MKQQQQFTTTERPTDVLFFLVGETAHECNASASTVRRVADEIRMPVLRTKSGCRIFTAEQVVTLKEELERRSLEALRR